MAAQITLYGSKVSPFSEKIELALREGNIPYKFITVPAITYGVPDVAPDDPSPLSFKLAESNVILEFIADLYPEAGLLPADPVQRAKVRFFMQIVGSKFFSHFDKWVDEGDPQARVALLEGIEFIQGLLPDSGAPKFAVGDCYTLADACITPFIQQLQICIEYDYGEFPAGDGPKLGETLKGPKYAKFMAYGLVATGRDIAKQLYNPEAVTGYLKQIYRTT